MSLDVDGFLNAEQVEEHGLTDTVAAAHHTERRRHHQRVIDAAIADGRLPQSRRNFWLNHLDKHPADAKFLANIHPATSITDINWPDR
ncbi:hypothetical protein ACIGKQ_16470 [Gordonia sp. NPDC062954]|uniref:hypothetical protein n=1 Tax=Gordonia sp. NPDC062954 TaxID=3364003 RepID=UPI0037C62145